MALASEAALVLGGLAPSALAPGVEHGAVLAQDVKASAQVVKVQDVRVSAPDVEALASGSALVLVLVEGVLASGSALVLVPVEGGLALVSALALAPDVAALASALVLALNGASMAHVASGVNTVITAHAVNDSAVGDAAGRVAISIG